METIQLSYQAEVAILRLNRPESLNSINLTMHAELRAALKEITKSSARCLLLTGTGKGFCSGQDLSDRTISPEMTDRSKLDLGESLEKHYNPLIRSLTNVSIPTVCALNGVAAGAGIALALACDILLMSEKSSLALAFSRIGLIPDSGCSWFLQNCLGNKRAMALALLSERITPQQAEDWGLVWKVYEPVVLQVEAEKLCQKLSAMPTKGMGYLKRCLQNAVGNNLSEQLDTERDFQRLAGRTSDYQEGVRAFIEKRKPHFTGK